MPDISRKRRERRHVSGQSWAQMQTKALKSVINDKHDC